MPRNSTCKAITYEFSWVLAFR